MIRFMIVFVILIFCFSNIAVGQTQQFFEVDKGVKPALALNSQDNPNICVIYTRYLVF